MNTLNWDGFRYFLAVAESGSLSGAARLLGSNQPTVGRYIDALETELGVSLLQRSVKGVSLTQEGQMIYEQSKAIHHSVIKIQRLSQEGKEEVSGTVRLSLPEGLAHEILIPALNNFYQQYPNVNLELNVSSAAANLARGEADIAVRLFRPEQDDLVVKFLGEMKMAVYASRDYRKNYGLPANLKQLDQHRIISYGKQLFALDENQWLLKHGDESLCVLHSDSTLARLNATLSGVGLSIQPEVIAEKHSELISVFSESELPSHNAWLVYHKDLRQVARIRAVNDFISSCLSNCLYQN